MDSSTLLHRQIHPSWVQNDIASSQAFSADTVIASLAFIPSPKDENKLSVYNGDKFTAENSYIHYTKGLLSHGVLSVTVGEVDCVGDLLVNEDNNPFDGHTVIDYSMVDTQSKVRKKAAKLRDIAIARGWTHK